MVLDDELREMIMQNAFGECAASRRPVKRGMRTLREAGLLGDVSMA
jgi:hypothetical protein